jgi:hypothetical protein
MFRAPRCAVLGFGLMLVAASTEAREVELSIENRVGGDSNVFRTSSNRTGDGFYAISPRLVLRERNSKLNYDFSYIPTYETYFETSGIDGFDHRGRANISWRPTAADSLGLNGNYTNRRSLDNDDGSGSSLQASDRERVQRSDVSFSYSRALNEALSVQTGATFTDLEFSRDTSTDSRSYAGQLGTQYVLNPITVVGLNATFRRREDRGEGSLGPILFNVNTDTDIWNVGVSIRRALTPNLSISAQAGPSFFRTEQESFLSSDTSDSTSYFASLVVKKSWQRSDLDASYTRSESAGSGNSSSSIVDNISLNIEHRLNRRLTLRILGSWIQSKEISDALGASKRKTTQYRVRTSLTHRITRQLSVVGQFLYLNQDQNRRTGGSGSESIGDVYVGFLSLRYTFDPIFF